MDDPSTYMTGVFPAKGEIPAKHIQRFGAILDRVFADSDESGEDEARSLISSIPVFMNSLLEEFGPEPWVMRTVDANAMFLRRRPRVAMLRESILVQLVAALELLLAELYRSTLFSRQYSKIALGDSNASVHMSALLEATSVEEIIRGLVEERVSAQMYGSIRDWFVWFDRTFGLRAESHLPDAAAFDEVVQRRHVIVHNDCTVSSEYLQRIGAAQARGLKVGDRLHIDDGYLGSAIDHVFVVGVRLASLTRDKLVADTVGALRYLSRATYESMKADQWWRSLHLAESEMLWSKTDKNHAEVAFANRLLSLKRLNGLDSIRSEIEKWDTSILNRRYVIAKHALLEDHSATSAALLLGLDGEDVFPIDLLDWPLLREFRLTAEFRSMLSMREALSDLTALLKGDALEAADERREASDDPSAKGRPRKKPAPKLAAVPAVRTGRVVDKPTEGRTGKVADTVQRTQRSRTAAGLAAVAAPTRPSKKAAMQPKP
ncbi:MAG: hypothetical protein ABMA25_09425 [Ilumatobacteraceae bacterium]